MPIAPPVRRSLLSLVTALAMAAAASSQSPSPPAPPPIAFVHVNVVPMDSERVLADQSLVVTDGRVASLGPSGDVKLPAGVQTIDGHNLWLMPGLVDSHIHILDPEEFALYLANGVTTVRNMSGEPFHLY